MRPAILLLLFCFTLLNGQEPDAFIFPDIDGFNKTIIDEVYTPETLFELIDGAADMFLAYDFENLHIAEYSNDSIRYIRVEAYRHKDAVNAFGAYAQERTPDARVLPVGCEGYIQEGALNFWFGSYYVKLVTNDQGRSVQTALERIAQHVAQQSICRQSLPSFFEKFPTDDRIPRNETYINRDYLGYRFFNKVFTASYNHSTVFVIVYKNAWDLQDALQAYSIILKSQQPLLFDTPTFINDPNEGRLLLQKAGNYIVGAKNIIDEKKALNTLNALITQLVR